MVRLKAIYLLSLVLFAGAAKAQSYEMPVVVNSGSIYVLKYDSGYIVEYLSPLKYPAIQYDTLHKSGDSIGYFRGERYFLLYINDEVCFGTPKQLIRTIRKQKCKGMKSTKPDDRALNERTRLHNYFYLHSYNDELTRYGLRVHQESREKFENFTGETLLLDQDANRMSYYDYKEHVNAFLNKCGIEPH